MSGVLSYSPNKVSVIVGGNIVQGLASGVAVTAMRNNDMWTLVSGMQGFSTRVKASDYSGKVTFTLQQTSPTNDVFNALYQADENSETGVVPIFIKDNSGRTVLTALTAWIVKPPQVDFGNELSNREWVFETDNLIMALGGN